MKLKKDTKEQTKEEWLESTSNDIWYSVYSTAYERWEYYKTIDLDRSSREYETMMLALNKGNWWRYWNSLLDNMPSNDECMDCEKDSSVLPEESELVPPEGISELVKEMFKLV